MGKGLDLDAWIAKVRARAGAAPPRRSPRVDAKRLARCARLFSSTRRGSAKIPKRHRERASPFASARSRVGGARQRIVTILAISRSTRVADLRAS
jgi:predicted ArsR family transcriptional regulator